MYPSSNEKWEQIGGDVNPLEYGGYFRQRSNGDWVHWDEPEEDSETYTVYSGQAPTAEDYDRAWVNWPTLLITYGLTDRPSDPYQQTELVGGYWGWSNVDSYPTEYTREGLAALLGIPA